MMLEPATVRLHPGVFEARADSHLASRSPLRQLKCDKALHDHTATHTPLR